MHGLWVDRSRRWRWREVRQWASGTHEGASFVDDQLNCSAITSAHQVQGTRFCAQRRALTFVDRVNDLASELGGLKFGIAWLKTPMCDLGGRSALEALEGNDAAFATAIGFIDDFLNAVPD